MKNSIKTAPAQKARQQEAFFTPATIYPKLTVNAPNDKYEQQADAMADRVMRMSDQDEEQAQMKPLAEGIQRKCAACDEEAQREPIMRKAQGGGFEAPANVSRELQSNKGNGGQLNASTLQRMNKGFGTDFSNVRIHTNARAQRMSQNIQAKAFTHGSDIYFNRGAYQPGSSGGDRLLAHELTHVVQQGGGGKGIQRKIEVPNGTKLDTKGYNHSKSGNIYSASKKVRGSLKNEIFTGLLASPRVFKLAGATSGEVSNNFMEHISARIGVVKFAAMKKYTFAAGSAMKMNPKFWIKSGGSWGIKPGVSQKDAINDMNIHPKKYAIACLAATKLTMLGGSGSNLKDTFSADIKDWIPGDWGYITNDNFTKKPEDVGLEGENIIYTGKNKFWGHFTGKNTYRKLKSWLREVKNWNGKASIENVRTIPAKGIS